MSNLARNQAKKLSKKHSRSQAKGHNYKYTGRGTTKYHFLSQDVPSPCTSKVWIVANSAEALGTVTLCNLCHPYQTIDNKSKSIRRKELASIKSSSHCFLVFLPAASHVHSINNPCSRFLLFFLLRIPLDAHYGRLNRQSQQYKHTNRCLRNGSSLRQHDWIDCCLTRCAEVYRDGDCEIGTIARSCKYNNLSSFPCL